MGRDSLSSTKPVVTNKGGWGGEPSTCGYLSQSGHRDRVPQHLGIYYISCAVTVSAQLN